MAGSVFGALYVLQVYKIVAGTVICEVWHSPRNSFAKCIGIVFFGQVCFHPFHCVLRFTLCLCFVNFAAGTIHAQFFLSLDLTWKVTFFRCHRSAIRIEWLQLSASM